MRTIKNLLGAKKTFWVIIGIFALQAVLFAIFINRNIPPDEGYHVGLIQYYSRQPIDAGPFIHHQDAQSLFLGDIQRIPNYMYHYVLGNFLRVMHYFINNENHLVYVLRLINVLMATGALLVFRKLFKEMKVKVLHQNLAFALMALTTMFVGISAAVNYDNAIFLIISLFLLILFRFVKRYSATDFMWLVVLGCLGLLVKYEFAVILLASAVVLVVQAVTDKKMLPGLATSFKKIFINKRLTNILLICVVLLSLGLLGERYGENVVKYHAIAPGCTKLHTRQECGHNMIYQRDVEQKIVFNNFIKSGGKVEYSPFGFIGDWTTQMYNNLFFYLGQTFVIGPSGRVQNVAAAFLMISMVAITMYYKRGSVLTNREDKMLAFITVFYVLALFLYNRNSYLRTNSFYGFQGRYLIPVLPFIYLFFARGFSSMCQVLIKKGRTVTVYGLVVFALLIGYLQMPVLVFYRGSDAAWYSESTKSISLKIQSGLTKLRIAQRGSLPGSHP